MLHKIAFLQSVIKSDARIRIIYHVAKFAIRLQRDICCASEFSLLQAIVILVLSIPHSCYIYKCVSIKELKY